MLELAAYICPTLPETLLLQWQRRMITAGLLRMQILMSELVSRGWWQIVICSMQVLDVAAGNARVLLCLILIAAVIQAGLLKMQVLGAGGGCAHALLCLHLHAAPVWIPGLVASRRRAPKGERLSVGLSVSVCLSGWCWLASWLPVYDLVSLLALLVSGCTCVTCRLSACLPACLSVCLSVCLLVCLPACLSVCLSVCVLVCVCSRRLSCKGCVQGWASCSPTPFLSVWTCVKRLPYSWYQGSALPICPYN